MFKKGDLVKYNGGFTYEFDPIHYVEEVGAKYFNVDSVMIDGIWYSSEIFDLASIMFREEDEI